MEVNTFGTWPRVDNAIVGFYLALDTYFLLLAIFEGYFGVGRRNVSSHHLYK